MTIAVHDHPCRVCGQLGSTIARQLTYPEHGYPGPFILRRCNACGVLFNSPRLDDADLAALYGRNYYFFNRTDAYAMRRTVPMYQRTVALIAPSIPVKRSLDIGCGRGYFPALLSAIGWQAAGVELSSDATAYARNHLNLDLFTGSIEQYAQTHHEQRWPLITAIDVIEHVPDPASFLASAASVLAPGGRLIIDTPNADSHNIAVLGSEWQGFNPFHIYLFTPASLSTAAQRAGLTVDRIFTYSNTPLDNHPIKRAQGSIWRQIKRLGLAAPAAKTFFATRRLLMPTTPIAPAIRQAAAAASAIQPFDSHPDASAPLAVTQTGDNLVLIASKAVATAS
jgi:SAM-dependent methyltransferase